MRTRPPMRLPAGLVLCVAMLLPSPGRADRRLNRLIQILRTDSSYKVRLRVVAVLGKKGDPRAVPALIGALSDDNHSVRGVAAAALAQIGDRRALPRLKQVARKDRSGFVRNQARRAINVIKAGKLRPRPGQRFFIGLGKVTNTSGRWGKRPVRLLREALYRAFVKIPQVLVQSDGRRPTPRELRKARLRGFLLNSSVNKLTRRRWGGRLELGCSIRVWLAEYPGDGVKAFYSGEAAMSVRGSGGTGFEEELFRDLFDGAAEEARKRITTGYLKRQ